MMRCTASIRLMPWPAFQQPPPVPIRGRPARPRRAESRPTRGVGRCGAHLPQRRFPAPSTPGHGATRVCRSTMTRHAAPPRSPVAHRALWVYKIAQESSYGQRGWCCDPDRRRRVPQLRREQSREQAHRMEAGFIHAICCFASGPSPAPDPGADRLAPVAPQIRIALVLVSLDYRPVRGARTSVIDENRSEVFQISVRAFASAAATA
jgi:hypothetical protein